MTDEAKLIGEAAASLWEYMSTTDRRAIQAAILRARRKALARQIKEMGARAS